MISNDLYLRPMLDSGSSRVFNCNDRSRKLVQEQAKDPYFFRQPKLHGIILIKEANVDRGSRSGGSPVVVTKLYFPYNHEDVYEGGRSIFFHDPRLLDVLNELFGLRGAETNQEDLQHDLKVLGILDRLPSLDGFLMRDALELDGIAANENYFEVSGSERTAIQEFIRRKFEPLVRAACDGEAGARVDQLIEKIWEAKDKAALDPLIRAFRFPDEEALSIFASWKGINFYTYEYYRSKKERERFGLWLRDGATPRNFVSREDGEHLQQMRKATVECLRERWTAVEAIAREYDTLYTNFLRVPEGVVEFLKFLRGSRQIYWRMGDALSRLSHAVHCWESLTRGYAERRLTADKLMNVFESVQLVLGAADEKVSAVVWD
ncbi:MAG: hypothetical protein ACREFQ_00785 [Stellaceae bacterium]